MINSIIVVYIFFWISSLVVFQIVELLYEKEEEVPKRIDKS